MISIPLSERYDGPSTGKISRILVLGLALSLVACVTPLKKVVCQDAPGFELKRPAQADGQLGRRLVNGQPETNACYKGHAAKSKVPSWTSRTLVYKDGVDGNLNVDFGPLFKGGVSGSENRSISVSLLDVDIAKLEGLSFDPTSTCATDDMKRAAYESSDGLKDEVIVEALQASKLSIEDTTSTAAKVAINTNLLQGVPVGAGTGGTVSTSSTWEGVNLFFAHRIGQFRVTLRKTPPCIVNVGGGSTCDLEACGVRVDTLSPQNHWTGVLTCQSGSSTPIAGRLGDWLGVEQLNGVSYSVRSTRGDGIGLIKVEFFRWNVLSD